MMVAQAAKSHKVREVVPQIVILYDCQKSAYQCYKSSENKQNYAK